MKVVVGSLNPAKVNAVKVSFTEAFPEETFKFVSFEAPSSVSDQPIGRAETKIGAFNRANACKAAHLDAMYYVGFEGGVEEIDGQYWTVAWMCILNNEGKAGFGSTGAFLLPPQIS